MMKKYVVDHFAHIIELVVYFHFSSTEAAKLRPWLNSGISMLEGDIPSIRCCDGFASAEDGKIYMFGGINPTGDCDTRTNIYVYHMFGGINPTGDCDTRTNIYVYHAFLIEIY